MGKDFIVSNAGNERVRNNQNGFLSARTKIVTFSCRVFKVTKSQDRQMLLAFVGLFLCGRFGFFGLGLQFDPGVAQCFGEMVFD